MKTILLSGGSGKRLWPLSNDARSKQFLKILENEKGDYVSMVQRVWSQLESVNLADSSIIATSQTQVDMIESQIGQDVPLIVEPQRRDTFPAIALAATYLYSVEEIPFDEVVTVLPVDPYVEDAFFERMKEIETLIKTSDTEIALVGVEPTYPSSKYGYMIPQDLNHNSYIIEVSHFKEKPSEEEAELLIEQGALWNTGVFGFKLEYLISLLADKGLPIHYYELLNQYGKLEKISFDYEVVEKAKNIKALIYKGYWKDLGTWNTLTEEMATNQIGRGIISPDSNNTHLVNELDIPVAVLGMTDTVVAVSADGILVTEKSASPRIKELMKDHAQRPMFEERRWGWYHVLDHAKYENGLEVLTKRISVKAGKNLSYQRHQKRSEVWTIVKGFGEFVLEDEVSIVKAGDVLQIPLGAKHGIKARSELEFIEVQTGTDLVEGDIERIFMTWEEVEEHCMA
ncbi:sugar phosphate nucleotidyltransferase [Halalkalibacterium ligniniphilum]|uniref:sugar phosphate nucleotidyltransferase n=1 Tax=Halalkalibacterium ligniniphilum TaxID=1134413 RepID=UPI000345559C|nr:sugar phosphate nucleotidyltransferase [Halalkalibacterium ligniniphilum]